jgi:hypothetical protein
LGWITLNALLLGGLGLAVRTGKSAWGAPGWEVWVGEKASEDQASEDKASVGVAV